MLRELCAGHYLYAMLALDGPVSGMISTSRKPTSLHHPAEVAAGEVESVSELDQHVERHHQPKGVLSPSVVDQVLDDDERASLWEGLVCRADQLHLPVEVPVMEDQAHRDHVRPG
jgi:hypothetical protein